MITEEALDKLLGRLTQPAVVNFGKDHQVLVIAEGQKLIDARSYMPPPARVRQKVELLSVPAFIQYLKRFGIGDSMIFANETTATYESVVDYHAPAELSEPEDQRGECDHVAVYNCPISDQWKTWNASSGKMWGQVEFATFIETNLLEIRQPAAADFLQLCLQLQIRKSANFESDLRLDNGQTRFRYQEEIRGTTKVGDIDIPPMMDLQMPVFTDGEEWGIAARFKYRMSDGKLALGYELIRPAEVYRCAVKAVTQEIRVGLPKIELVIGQRK